MILFLKTVASCKMMDNKRNASDEKEMPGVTENV